MPARTTTDRLLIVAEAPEDRGSLRRMLGRPPTDGAAAFVVETVTTAGEALEVLRAGAFDGVVIDDRPPAIDASRLLADLADLATGPPLLAAIVLGEPDAAGSRVADAFRQGADDYLFRGQYDGAALRRSVRAAIGRARARIDRERDGAGRTQVEVRLRHRLALMETLARATAEGLAMLDPQGRFTLVNPAASAIFGRDEASLLGQSLADLLADLGEGGDGTGPPLAAVIGSDQAQHGVATWPGGSDDGAFLVAFEAVPVVVDGTLTGTVLSLRDATEQGRIDREASRRAAELVDAGRRKDEFLAILAHELRNPLAPILNAMRIIGLRGGNDPAQAPIRAMVERQVRHMTRLIDDLLDMSRVARGTIVLRREPTPLADALDRAVEATRHLFEGRGQKLEVDQPDRPLVLDADPTRLDQILSNLLANAAKYTDPGGRVRLSAALDDGQAVIRVTDNGVGIAPDFLPRVFELFAQADPSLDRSRGGLGIGLTLVRDLVDLHGGAIAAASEGVGRGSEFTVRLPTVAEAEAPPPEGSPVELGPAPAARPLRVLVVDDNVEAAESLAAILGLWGHRADVAHDGASALDLASQRRPEVILLDISLPDTDGYQVARRFRADPRLAEAQILAMTGFAGADDRRRSEVEGLDGHLVKPVDLDHLERLLAAID